jgi:hypothetical protein
MLAATRQALRILFSTMNPQLRGGIMYLHHKPQGQIEADRVAQCVAAVVLFLRPRY